MTAELAKLNLITKRQRALITREQAMRAGLTNAQIETLLRRAVLIAIRPNVYALAGAPASWEQSALAAVLAAGPRAYASHSTARLWGFRHFEQPDHLDVVAPLGRKIGLAGVLGHRSRELFDDDLTIRLGIPVVSAARAPVDVAAALRGDTLGATLDNLLRRRVLTLEDLRRCVGRLHPGPGRSLVPVHRVLADRWPGYDPGESDLETRALRAIVKAGLPPPRQQYRIRLRGKPARIDLAYPDEKIAIEVDSWEFHGQVRSQFDVDHIRRDDVVVLGWAPLTFTSAMNDHYFTDSVRALLEAAWARIGRSGAA
jgi:hypothetical protein